jgi:effector-binding domain-containing protein
MIDTPEVVESPAQPTAAIRFTIPRAEIQAVMGPAFGELFGAVGAQAIGPAFSLHFRIEPEIFDFELGIPVSGPVREEGRVRASELPAAKVARTIYHGPYEGLAEAWGQLDAWIVANGHKGAPNLWERYVVGPESQDDPANWQTELNHPLVP